jgi:hypothetical protein
MPDRPWSHSEKKIARRAYEAARQAVLAATLAEFKARAAAATTIDDMWSIVDASRERQRELEEMLGYRYSRLPYVFARLIVEGYLNEEQLTGLSEDNLNEIRRDVSFFRRR